MKLGRYEFKQTCSACPEQYDVFNEEGAQVAYVRLRWGSLYAECPDVGGTEIYYTGVGNDAGCFRSEDERRRHLRKIAKRIDLFNQPIKCPYCGEHHKICTEEFNKLETGDYIDVDCFECDNYYLVKIADGDIVVSKPY